MHALHHYVLVHVNPDQEKVSEGGIVIANEERPTYHAEVLSIGPKVPEDVEFEVGNTIVVGRKAGDFLHEELDSLGNPYIVHYKDILVRL